MHYSEIPRHPLGLPPGSVRAIIALQIALTFWLLLLVPEDRKIQVPLNFYFLLMLIMIYFTSHGKSIARKSDPTPSPLWLPGGSIRFIVLGGTMAVIGYAIYLHQNDPESPNRLLRLSPSENQLHEWKNYLGALLIGFFSGFLIKFLPFRHGWAYMSFQAWVAILAMFSLVLDMILQTLVRTTLADKDGFVVWQTAVTGIAAFYYGSRS